MKAWIILIFFTIASLALIKASGKQVLNNICSMNKWMNYGNPAEPRIQTWWDTSIGLEEQVYLIHYREGDTSLEGIQSK